MKYWAFCIIVDIWDEKSRLEDSLMPRVVTIKEVGIGRRSGEVSWKNVLDLENIIESVLVILREREFIENQERRSARHDERDDYM